MRLTGAAVATAVVAFALPTATALAAAGQLDSSFGVEGKAQTGFGVGSLAVAEAVAVQADGMVVAAGWTDTGGDRDFALTRHDVDGDLDTSFGGDGTIATDIGTNTHDAALAIGLQPDGRIVVAGESNGSLALARYNANGILDDGFDGDGKLTTGIGSSGGDASSAVAIQPDGKIVVAGHSDSDFALARYNASGSLDDGFDGDGKLTTDIGTGSTDEARAMALQSDGKIVAAGESDGDFALARYNASGSLDTNSDGGPESHLDTDGKLVTDIGAGSGDAANGVAVQGDGKIVAAGNSSVAGDYDFALARYTTNGTLDAGFDGDGMAVTDFDPAGEDAAAAVLVQANAKILAVGYSGENFALGRYRTDGSLDASFDSDGLLVTDIASGSADSANAATLDGEGRIVAAGSANEEFAVARFHAGPAAPQITATDPASPSSDPTPKVKGTATPESATVQVFTRADCAGTAVSDTKDAFVGSGIEVPVGTNKTTQLSARATDAAGDTSACSNNLAYTHDDERPAAPRITDSDPAPPSNDNAPALVGEAPANTTVKLYESADCGGPVEAEGSAAEFASPGLTAAVADGATAHFSAIATDETGDASPCSGPFVYTEDSTAPDSRIESGPADPTDDPTPTFTFSSPEGGASFECRLDGGSFSPCASPHTTASLADGSHAFEVRARDLAGNTDQSPASRTFSVDTQAPAPPQAPAAPQPGDPDPPSPAPDSAPESTPENTAERAPEVHLAGKTVQKADDPIKVQVGCDEPCDVTATGAVTVKHSERSHAGAARRRSTFKLKPVVESVPAFRTVTLVLKPSRKNAKQLRRALALGAKAEALIEVSAVDAAGNASTARRAVKLKG